MKIFKGLQIGTWLCLMTAGAFLHGKLQDLFWYFSDHQTQERYWSYLERKAAKKKKR